MSLLGALNPVTKYLGLGCLAALLLCSGALAVQTLRLKSANQELTLQAAENQSVLDKISSNSKEVALLAEAEALRTRATQLEEDKRLSDEAAKRAEERRASTTLLLNRLQKERENEARNDPQGCLSRNLSSGSLERLRAAEEAGSGDGNQGSGEVREGPR